MQCIIVSHTHWDREWYKTFQSFRARLVDTVDRVLDHVAADPDYFFQLDGQAIVVEDYLEVRPERRPELLAAVEAGRVAIGPWYVQPDSLIPGAETHVRNLLEGRRVAEAHGGCSTIAYTPDSFGHPAQFPQLFAGFGLGPFIYWRGNADEIADLPTDYRWQAPDGSSVVATHLARGYFAAWGFKSDPERVAKRLETLAKELRSYSQRDSVLLMNGLDHMLPDANTRVVAEALAKRTGWTVERGLFDAYAAGLASSEAQEALPSFQGELIGGRVANLLPGVWSTHVDLKLANRQCESALVGWTEPFSALGRFLGTPDETPSLRLAWRELLPNQAHDSICGCSQDRVHEQMTSRLDSVLDLSTETTLRLLERIAGLGPERQLLESNPDELEIAVFNPSPQCRTDRVRFALDGFPAFTSAGVNPYLAANQRMEGFELTGAPVRVVEYSGNRRAGLAPAHPVYDLEFVAEQVPAMGWRRFVLRKAKACDDVLDRGTEIGNAGVTVQADADGTFAVRFGSGDDVQRYAGIGGIEDLGDRGDTYDFDPVTGHGIRIVSTDITRRRHPGGLQELEILREIEIPVGITSSRDERSDERIVIPLRITARVAPGVERVDLQVSLDNRAEDHRLRLLFPTGIPTAQFEAASHFDTAVRSTAARDGSQWIHPAPATFPQQGFVHVNGLSVAAPGLLEAEVTPEGCLALTLMRSTGWLSRPDLTTRPDEAGPSLRTPGAQCKMSIDTTISLYPGLDPGRAQAAELGLWATACGPAPLVAADQPLLEVAGPGISMTTFKPAEDRNGAVVRLLNTSDVVQRASVRLAPIIAEKIDRLEAVRLDESPTGELLTLEGGGFEIELPPRALRSIALRTETQKSTP
jgi:mannosylglycerate hydrolase